MIIEWLVLLAKLAAGKGAASAAAGAVAGATAKAAVSSTIIGTVVAKEFTSTAVGLFASELVSEAFKSSGSRRKPYENEPKDYYALPRTKTSTFDFTEFLNTTCYTCGEKYKIGNHHTCPTEEKHCYRCGEDYQATKHQSSSYALALLSSPHECRKERCSDCGEEYIPRYFHFCKARACPDCGKKYVTYHFCTAKTCHVCGVRYTDSHFCTKPISSIFETMKKYKY